MVISRFIITFREERPLVRIAGNIDLLTYLERKADLSSNYLEIWHLGTNGASKVQL